MTEAEAMEKARAVGQRCPESCCDDKGWYVVADSMTGEPLQEQCEFCYTQPGSVFRIWTLLRSVAAEQRERDAVVCDHGALIMPSKVMRAGAARCAAAIRGES